MSFQISSRADSVTIQGVKLNRGNCVVNFVPIETVQASVFIPIISIIPTSMQDLKDMASVYKALNQKKRVANIENKISQLKQKGVMMEPQTLNP
ncbi:hypothetical protein VN1027_14440 [Helicobacter pylori]|nr:hypothetical protein VN1027_14440 [Helicobacter pylori]